MTEEGLTTQGGRTTTWDEIGAVDIVTEQIQHTDGRHIENRAAAAATNAALEMVTGYDGYVTRLKITITEQAHAAAPHGVIVDRAGPARPD